MTSQLQLKFDVVFSDESIPCDYVAVVKAIKVKQGQRLTPGSSILSYVVQPQRAADRKDTRFAVFKAAKSGLVVNVVDLKTGSEIRNGDVLLTLLECPHACVMKDMCADCGENLRVKDGLPGERILNTPAKVSMIHSIPELQVTIDEAHRLGSADENNLLRQRKLVLLVDLDQTLIHTTNDDVDPDSADIFHFQLYGANTPWYHVRVRPHTLHFLRSMSSLYELHICTFGARLYAHKVATLLDPDKSIFGQRILSRDECFSPLLKTANLRALFPCGDRLVCIIDDRDDVWNFSANVIRVKPYKYFKHTGDINAPPGFEKADNVNSNDNKHDNETSSREKDAIPDQKTNDSVAVDDTDDYMLHLEEILRKIHTAFYQLYDQMSESERPPDTHSVVPYVRSKVLKNVHMVLSGVIPLTETLETSLVYKQATSFGAVVQRDIVPLQVANEAALTIAGERSYERRAATTHLVAAVPSTSKVQLARKLPHQIKIVTPDWLWCCMERWEKVNERLFQLKRDSKPQTETLGHQQYSTSAADGQKLLFKNQRFSRGKDSELGDESHKRIKMDPEMTTSSCVGEAAALNTSIDDVIDSASSSSDSSSTSPDDDDDPDDVDIAAALDEQFS